VELLGSTSATLTNSHDIKPVTSYVIEAAASIIVMSNQ
jgi:hypothetical protein